MLGSGEIRHLASGVKNWTAIDNPEAVLTGGTLNADGRITFNEGSDTIQFTCDGFTHTLTANFTDSECETQFTVAAAPKPVSPQTGDEGHLLMWSLVSMVSLAAAMVMALPRKKREK